MKNRKQNKKKTCLMITNGEFNKHSRNTNALHAKGFWEENNLWYSNFNSVFQMNVFTNIFLELVNFGKCVFSCFQSPLKYFIGRYVKLIWKSEWIHIQNCTWTLYYTYWKIIVSRVSMEEHFLMLVLCQLGWSKKKSFWLNCSS